MSTIKKVLLLLIITLTLTACSSKKELNVTKETESKIETGTENKDENSYEVKTFDELNLKDGEVIKRDSNKLLEEVKKEEFDFTYGASIMNIYENLFEIRVNGVPIIYDLDKEKIIDVLPYREFRLDGCCSYTAIEMYDEKGKIYIQNGDDQFDPNRIKKPDYHYEYNIENKEFKIVKGALKEDSNYEYDGSKFGPMPSDEIKIEELSGYVILSGIVNKKDGQKIIIVVNENEKISSLSIVYLDRNNKFIEIKSIYE